MSKGFRDRRGRPHSDKKCPESASGGCVYCRTGSYKKQDRRARRQRARNEIRREAQERT